MVRPNPRANDKTDGYGRMPRSSGTTSSAGRPLTPTTRTPLSGWSKRQFHWNATTSTTSVGRGRM